MKRIFLIFLAIGLVTIGSTSMASMSISKVRKNTRFLTDRMAYELNLSNAQYNDIYEINFDFVYNVRNLMDDVVYGDEWALNDYYRYLDIRNDDLRWVMSSSQYRRFLNMEYFYRPIYASGRNWNFRVYVIYSNHNHFYFGRPYHYRTYCGGHYRTHYHNMSYYKDRYHHDIYNGHYSTKRDEVYQNNRRSDFGVTSRPSLDSGSSSRPSTGSSSNRPSNTTRPGNGTSTSSRPSGSSSSRPSSSGSSNSGSSSRPSNSSSSNNSSNESSRPSSSSNRGSSSSSSRGSSSSSSRVSNGSSSGSSTRESSRPSSSSSRSSSDSNSGSSSRSNSSRR